MKFDIKNLKLKIEGLKLKLQGLKTRLQATRAAPKISLKVPKLRIAAPNLKRLLGPRVIITALMVIIALSIVFVQFKIKERIFKKPVPKEMKPAVEEGAMPQEPILVKVYKVQKRDFEDNLPLLGTIKGFKEIDLKFETSGIVDSFNFKEGEKIEEGEIVATLNQKDALLKLKYNEIELEKTQKLFDIGAIVKSKLDQVKLELESAKRELDKTYMYAPRNGVLGTKDTEVGEFITYNDKIATLIDDKEIFVDVGIIEKDIGKVKVGQTAKVTVDTYPDTEFAGTVDTVSPVIEGKSRTQSAKIKIKNPKGQLLPGMFARAAVAVYKTQGAVIIPNTSLDKTEEGYVTYVVKKAEEKPEEAKEETPPEKSPKKKSLKKEEEAKEEIKEEEGVAEARPIKADYRSSDFFVVKEGLEEGDLVVVETQEKLKDGYKVIITETQEVIF